MQNTPKHPPALLLRYYPPSIKPLILKTENNDLGGDLDYRVEMATVCTSALPFKSRTLLFSFPQ